MGGRQVGPDGDQGRGPDGARVWGQIGAARWEWASDGGQVDGPDGGAHIWYPIPLSGTHPPYLVPHPSYLVPHPLSGPHCPYLVPHPRQGTPTLTSHQSGILHSVVVHIVTVFGFVF